MTRRIDLLALSAAVLTFGVVLLYLVLVAQEGGDVAGWAVALLTLAGVGALYGAWPTSRARRAVLWPSAAVLFFLGYLTILSIGLPLILACALCVLAAMRARPRRDWRDLV
ncbi:MAG: hypothetical protein HOQ45_21415 [Nocardioidaceae bacterium]|nr:hypothetical protein [Nocardioidaceae bacterium]